jgi:hypothetical protein
MPCKTTSGPLFCEAISNKGMSRLKDVFEESISYRHSGLTYPVWLSYLTLSKIKEILFE